MFSEFKFRRRCWAAYDKLAEPELRGNRLATVENAIHTEERHAGSALRVAACMAMALALVGVILFQNTGGFSTKTVPAPNGAVRQERPATANSFTLIAYAASPSASSESASSADIPAGTQMQADSSTGVTLHPNVTVTLPSGKYYSGVYTSAYASFFQFTGDAIKSVTMTTVKGNMGASNGPKVKAFLSPILQYDVQHRDAPYQMTDSDRAYMKTIMTGLAPSITFPPDFTAFWMYDSDQSHSDISDTIAIQVNFQDGMVQNKTVTIGEGDDHNITVTLSDQVG